MRKEGTTAFDKDRFDISDCSATMKAVVTTGNGGYEKLDYRDVPIPELVSNEVLLQVLAAGAHEREDEPARDAQQEQVLEALHVEPRQRGA